MPRPLIGICAAVEPADFGPWRAEPAALVPLSYPRSIQAAGGIPVLLPPDRTSTEEPDELLDRIDALVLGGGSDIDAASHGAEAHPETRGTNPERDRFELALASRAMARGIPLLGICRGMQILNVATGGSIDQHMPERLGNDHHRPVPGKWARHDIRLAPGSLAARAAGAEQLTVKSHHHQGVDALGSLDASGWDSEDDTVEAVESPDGAFTLGVLWHPEEDPDDQVIPTFVASSK
jgi:putative glutamine amidotransferase